MATPTLLSPLEVLRQFDAHDFSIDQFFQARLRRLSEQPMVEYQGSVTTWQSCAEQADHAVGWLLGRGVQAGDRIGLMAYNHPATVVLLIACARVGAILVPCNPEFEAREAQYIFEHAGVRGVICSTEALSKVQEATCLMSPAPWQVVIEQDQPDGEMSLLLQWQCSPPDLLTRTGTADSTCMIIYTSGTTGFPKGVMHSQRSYLLTAEAFVHRMYLQPDERLMCVLPLFHINALMYSLGGAMACGGTLILIRRFSASTFWQQAAQTRATEVNVIMSAAAILARRPIQEFDAQHSIRKMFLAPLNRDLLDTFQQRFHVPVLIECYGMTEIPGVLSNPFMGPHKLGSMGCISAHPDPAIERPQVRVIDEDGQDLPMGEVGELAVKTPTLMQGYFKDPEQTTASFKDGWFLTGDLVRRDADDFLFFFTRKKDIIRRRGENISGAEIDSAIGSHPDILECASIGVASDLGEEEILLAVVPRPGTTITPEAVHAYAQLQLSPIKRPRYIVMVESLPHTGSMKIAKFRLKPADHLRRQATDFSLQEVQP
ncbi:class I adenylate-forming enzyme family protein [Limnohabitans sp. WS1]|uniref:class I adenylate-forming enzyme family protein n=1 Tax=Limnohabitans sp. WS1 TaxID=1100726 RepID=UPI000D363003|nr:AMP-binding protein [Limnohabitans sp. WS1]PUE11970.1 long-chain fatty acid--CoA ligase [Limnohabitans sp. WS1]